ncbi:hypothetical protein GCM10009105_10350 [Dokdonella soli]|uniref:Uncharacterized protein n=1 Tax=Dokdonella soli TaxID=529810 RepID=A0ABN1IDZ0_9GAMM
MAAAPGPMAQHEAAQQQPKVIAQHNNAVQPQALRKEMPAKPAPKLENGKDKEQH